MSGDLSRAGAAWTAEDERRLLEAFADGAASPGEVAAACGRTRAAVLTRLVRLGRLVQTSHGYFLPTPYASLSAAKEPTP